jgi:glycosyltransferase involved in cell wall biosynthesis
VQGLGRALAERGHQVRVVGVYSQKYAAPDYEVDHGVRVWRLREPDDRPLGWLRARYRLFRLVAEWTQKKEIQLIEIPDFQGWAAGWPSLSVPVIARLNGSSTYFAAELGVTIDRTTYWLERLSLHRANFLISASRYAGAKTKKLFTLHQEPKVLYNPVPIPNVAIATHDGPKKSVIFSGTLTYKKGVVTLVRAWSYVIKKCPEAELHLFGKDGRHNGRSMQEYLQRLVDHDVCARLHFHGHVPRDIIFEAFCTARVAVFPSLAEAFAIAPMEAMSYGCPTIYSRNGSGPELIEDGSSGILVNPEDPFEIAESIVTTLKNDEYAKRLGEAGQRRIRELFSMKTLVQENESFYSKCIEECV